MDSNIVFFVDGQRYETTNVHKMDVAKLHNDNGPAYIKVDGTVRTEIWYRRGLKHRNDGPAVVIYTNGDTIKHMAWWLNDIRYNYVDDFLKHNNELSDEEKLLVVLTYQT